MEYQHSPILVRLASFSDAVFAIIITIMVLDFHTPADSSLHSLATLFPVFVSYGLSFAYLVTYWNNHNYLLKTLKKPDGRVMWANAFLLFCLSFFPFATAWVGAYPGSLTPTMFYCSVFFFAGLAYWILTHTIIAVEGKESVLARAVSHDYKDGLSMLLYAIAFFIALVNPWFSYAFIVSVFILWIVPDRRIVREFKKLT
jgi:uncharacterized membrane protein